MPPLQLLRSLPRRPAPSVFHSWMPSIQTTPSRLASSNVDRDFDNKKQAQEDRVNIDRQSDENALSGTDDAVAQDHSVSFDGSKSTDPAEARKRAGRGNDSNPLDVSAANPDVSSAAKEDGYAAKQKETVTYAGETEGRSNKHAVPENKGSAGRDKRAADSPQEVAKKSRIFSPGSR